MGKRVQINQIAPDFSLPDANGNKIQLSNFRGVQNILLVFNRGFV
jgi:peroxiredoxin